MAVTNIIVHLERGCVYVLSDNPATVSVLVTARESMEDGHAPPPDAHLSARR